jgi:LPXTG-motif cell wall-anchored protein
MVRLAADNGGSPTLVDVLIRSVSVSASDAGPPEELPPRPSRWPLWAGLGAGAVILGGGYWYWRRR